MGERFIYRLELGDAPPIARQVAGTEAFFIDGPRSFVALAPALRDLFGGAGAVKALVKVTTGRRSLCGFFHGGRIACHVWSTAAGKHYRIEPNACVLGPLRTEHAMQCRGLASAALRNAVAHLSRCGYRIFYIDPAPTNVGSQTAIERAGFGEPFARLQKG